jgi:DNA primase
MAWVSFDEIKQRISLEMVIDRYGWKLRRTGPTVLRGRCPLPTHRSQESSESFTATLDKGTGGAWSCHSQSCAAGRGGKKGGNALDLVAAAERCSIRDAATKLIEWFPAQGATLGKKHSPDPGQQTENPSRGESGDGQDVNKPLQFQLKGIDPAHPYLQSRGVTQELAERFGVGYFSGRGSMHGRLVFPIHNKTGELVAYAGRAIDESKPKYKFPAGFHKSLELYNLHRTIEKGNPKRRIVIVEGFFDCLKVSAAGFPCVALMGSSISEVQAELVVRHFKAAYVLLDGDEAGQRGAEECLMRLGRCMFIYAPMLWVGKQPDILSAEEIRNLMKI